MCNELYWLCCAKVTITSGPQIGASCDLIILQTRKASSKFLWLVLQKYFLFDLNLLNTVLKSYLCFYSVMKVNLCVLNCLHISVFGLIIFITAWRSPILILILNILKNINRNCGKIICGIR